MRRSVISIAVLAASAASMPTAIAQVAYGPAETIAVGAWAYGTEIADVTGDGRPDLIVTTLGEVDPAWDWKVLVYTQLDDGTLAAPAVYEPNGTEPSLSPALGDLDDDGDTDLVVTHDTGVDVFLQAGGVFTGPTSYPAPAAAIDVAVADLDADGRDDVVYSVAGETSYTYVRRLQLADGTLSEPVTIGSSGSEWFLLGDLTDDGRPDVLVEWPTPDLTYFEQQVDGSFVEETDPRIGGPLLAAVADVSGDGELDLVHSDSFGLHVMEGDGAGGFADPVTVGGPANLLEVGDVDGDSLSDVVANSAGRTTVLLQDGSGGLSDPCGFDGLGPGGHGRGEGTALGDLNGDGTPDLVAGGLVDPLQISYQLTAPGSVGSSIDIFGPNGVTYGDQIEISGNLRIDGGCMEVQSVDLWRSIAGGPAELIATDDDLILTNGGLAGTYSFDEVIPAAGEITYHVSWAGTDIHAPTQSPDLTLLVDKVDSRVSLIGDRLIEFGDGSTLTATLREVDGGDVSFYEIKPSGAERLIATKPVNHQGKAKVTVSPSANTRFVARFLETDVAEESSDSILVKVSVVTTGKMTHYSYKSGGYAIYDCCRSYFWFKVAPGHGGQKVSVKLQVYLSGAWRSYDPWLFKLKANSTAEIFIDIDGGTGYRFRVQACMPNHADHVGDCSPRAYFRYR